MFCILTPDPAHDIGLQDKLVVPLRSRVSNGTAKKVDMVSRPALVLELLPDAAERGRNGAQTA
jgi:hypothetical protein